MTWHVRLSAGATEGLVMTGKEFEAGMKHLGLSQTRMAEILRCDRGTIAARCKAALVDESYRYIMLGMLAERAANALVLAVGSVSKNSDKC